jgi:hypothetical protein
MKEKPEWFDDIKALDEGFHGAATRVKDAIEAGLIDGTVGHLYPAQLPSGRKGCCGCILAHAIGNDSQPAGFYLQARRIVSVYEDLEDMTDIEHVVEEVNPGETHETSEALKEIWDACVAVLEAA